MNITKRKRQVMRKLRVQGSSLVVTIPPDIAGILGWEEGDEIGFELMGNKLVLFKTH